MEQNPGTARPPSPAVTCGLPVPLAPRFDSVTLVVSDVDDTLALPFRDISASLAHALTRLVGNGTILFLVSGQGIGNIERRVVRAFPRLLRRRILVGHCHGAEVFGYDHAGRRVIRPLFSVREGAAMEGVFRKAATIVTGVLNDHGIAASSRRPTSTPICACSPRCHQVSAPLTSDQRPAFPGLRTARAPGPAGVLDYLARSESE